MWLVWTIWTSMCTVLKKAAKSNHSLNHLYLGCLLLSGILRQCRPEAANSATHKRGYYNCPPTWCGQDQPWSYVVRWARCPLQGWPSVTGLRGHQGKPDSWPYYYDRIRNGFGSSWEVRPWSPDGWFTQAVLLHQGEAAGHWGTSALWPHASYICCHSGSGEQQYM